VREVARRWAGWVLTLIALSVLVGALLFDRPQPEKDRAQDLAERLRCPVCQGESIADSPASMAREMRALVEEQVEAGKSDAEVVAFFRSRYGDWVLLDQPASGSTLLVWVLPVAALAGGIAAVMAYRTRSGVKLPSDSGLLAERRAQTERDLAELDQQVAEGDLEPEIADRLRPSYEEELAAVETALATPAEEVDGAATSAARKRTLVGSGVVVIACVGIALGVSRSTEPRPPGGTVTGNQPAAAPRDLSQVSNEEMEAVIRANPTVVPMRLALVERYLRAGDLAKAREHSKAALDQDPAAADKQRALKYLGWTTASLGDAQAGAQLLEQSLAMAPEDIDAKWFLAQVRLEALGDRAGAASLLESILADTALPADKRSVVEAKLSEARRSA
jgi:cytochrome c-type biogenesis protein CcmH/NrfF